METLEIKQLTSQILKSEEVKCGNYRVGYGDDYYYAGSLFTSQEYCCVETIEELKNWLTANK